MSLPGGAETADEQLERLRHAVLLLALKVLEKGDYDDLVASLKPDPEKERAEPWAR